MGLDVTNAANVSCVASAGKRNGGALHRNAIAAVDVCAVPTVGAASAITEGGSTLANANMKYTVAAGNRWGPTTTAGVQNITPTANQAVRFSISQVAGADYYDIFLSQAAAPLWVGRLTEAQRAAGGFIISAVGTVSAGGGAPAGSVDIGIEGTGLASNVSPFDKNNAWRPDAPTPIDCTGFVTAKILAKLAVTDLRSLPTLKLGVFTKNQIGVGDWHFVSNLDLALLTTINNPLEQELTVNVNGATGLSVLINTISGQGAAATIHVELA